MPIVGPDANTEPSSAPAPQMGGGASEIQKVLSVLEKSEIDAILVDGGNLDQVNLTITKIEKIISDYSQTAQNPQLFNKWLGLETKLTKALKEFQSNLRLLLAGVTQMGQAQAMLADQIPPNVGTPSGEAMNAPAPHMGPETGNMDAGRKALPTGGE